MSARTPDWPEEAQLAPKSSRYVKLDALPWRETAFPGVEIKLLLEDKETGLMTSLTRMAPGAVLPLHEHAGIEQTFVIEGRLVDDEGEVRQGEYVWRPAGSRHVARAPEGALLLGMFLQPNRFL
ncbi:MAG TPA: cupin domain-containing protein [Burkholderiales bacterium]|nr:cupin domain-containing protein [Burkholderiales bacterium]